MVAPDTAEHIREFAARFEPGFPVLCDEGGAIVRSYALRNPNIAGAPHMTSDDVPFPGHLLIAPGGVVVDKSFTGDLRHRASATLLVSRTVGPTGGPEARLQSDEVAVAVELSAGAVYGGQEIGLTIGFEPAGSWHLYAPGCSARYEALAVEVESELVEAVEVTYPPGIPVRLEGLGEEALVYDRPVTIRARLRTRWRPELFWRSERGPEPLHGLEHLVSLRPDPGSYPVRVRLRYQACSEDTCLPPANVTTELPVELLDDVPAASAIRPKLD